MAELLGEGAPPIEPAPETAVFTPVDTSEPQSLSRRPRPARPSCWSDCWASWSCAA